MALLGISLIVASVVLLILRRPEWLQQFWRSLYRQASQNQLPRPPQRPIPRIEEPKPEDIDKVSEKKKKKEDEERIAVPEKKVVSPPPPPPPTVVIQENGTTDNPDSPREEQTTPKASAANPSDSVPAFTLSVPELPQQQPKVEEPAVTSSSLSTSTSSSSTASPSMMMPPPPLPVPAAARGGGGLSANLTRQPGTSTLPLPNRPSGGPLPNRGPGGGGGGGGGGSGGLFPPPTHSTKPAKPSRAVVLTPGHSPLDWARLSGHPTADLRGLPKETPYLRVTPSILKKMTGRKGKDAWMVLGGRVYNITPYIPFHPGGEPELLRGAGRDGTKLFGEIHPWVNYEGMLAACLVGIYVSEEDGEAALAAAAAAAKSSGASTGEGMDEMD
ncbi:hypothetical protein SMACR_07416 [Sordaria macrospora]|uniref:WGS project CABT00000000 data, contig 2.1 n=2 Tax=Sordaria macrospora TaxID=5147 RepID=F7VM46_SORMK|nr:uncharacterized protein SMAC_07416 [Sordaria macrospora k-hell]KAA8629835.1 hypothetical protein SMACR_07416 [Sordaria macrospora]KAH7626000.1 hypothetical protein B0T09DRAFT_351576 [Sordaria sp. MPI-SDFR-AT-0083]WPJ65798.1 hypothetical protein SMAC4_07416 [Sordaria macrospora]CCC06574.1 unnamed protein product [Sordaria macrospora k-hell]